MNARAPLLAPDTGATRAQQVARLALRSLHQELLLYPKPGLVSLVDTGSHADMDASTFMRSLFALRHYFAAICIAGSRHAPMAQLRQLGMRAETRMLAATAGVNTHRGAIFTLGLLCAAAGSVPECATPTTLRAAMLRHWGAALAADARQPSADSHGACMAALHGASGALAQAAQGFPAIFHIGLPALHGALAAGRGIELARIDTLFALMAALDDTNVLYRGGAAGAALVRNSAADFLAAGGTADPRWRDRALAAHHAFVARRLSPGGAADLLAACCLVHALCETPA